MRDCTVAISDFGRGKQRQIDPGTQ